MKKIKGYEIQFDFSHFQRIADLIAFEGLLLSHYISDKGEDYLFYWVESDENNNRWLALRVSLANLQKYVGKELSLRQLIDTPNDGFLYCLDVDSDLNYHNILLVQPANLPADYLPDSDSYYEFEPIPAENAGELMTYELTIPFKERSRFEEILVKIGVPITSLKKVVSHAAIF